MKKFDKWLKKTDERGFLNPEHERLTNTVRTVWIGAMLLFFLYLLSRYEI